MNIIEEVYKDREDLARVLKKHTGIRKIVEDLYPDSAHFIYELLQNAEDTSATDVKFILSKYDLIFEHDGRSFEESDIYAITDIGEGTKADDNEKIGRYGIGFKAVFAYTETPRILSPTFSFQIDELVLPSILPNNKNSKLTRFEFPFNNSKKDKVDAFEEILKGLEELSSTTLLFLSNIKSIKWIIEGQSKGIISRIIHSNEHIEIVKQLDNRNADNSHYLRFMHPVADLKSQSVAIAFELDKLPNIKSFNPKLLLSKQFKIVPASPGRVSVFFVADKEVSGLRFHLHAPFVPELSRASIKDTPVNTNLFDEIAELAGRSLYMIRDLNFLNSDFLGVMPNPHDDIPERYQIIRKEIVREMNNNKLTPTYSKKYAPAKLLLQSKASIKKLISIEDIKIINELNDEVLDWSIGSSQKNSNADRFLSSLELSDWGIDDLLSSLEDGLGYEYYDLEGDYFEGSDPEYLKWISGKTLEWHQMFYALLYRELWNDEEFYRLTGLSIVRTEGGKYLVGQECYFASDGIENHDMLPIVDFRVYESGKKSSEKIEAKKLLEELDVGYIGEAELIKIILDSKYNGNNTGINKEEIERFIDFIEKDSRNSSLFYKYNMFKDENGEWNTPENVYLDAPFCNTGLSTYYAVLEGRDKKSKLSNEYLNCGINIEKFVAFTKTIGVIKCLEIIKGSTSHHPLKKSLHKHYWQRHTNTKIDTDWNISNLFKILLMESIDVSKLIWITMVSSKPEVINAKFRPNQQYPTQIESSTLIIRLRDLPWVPQGKDLFLRPAESSHEKLPKGFTFDRGWKWLEAIEFGKKIVEKTEEHVRKQELAKELGFDDKKSLDDAKRFVKLDSDERERFFREYERRNHIDLPNLDPKNPERRAERVGEMSLEAPERDIEIKERSVSVGRDSVKKESVPYLRQMYTNSDDEMICQVCKQPLPFRLANGSHYFESVEFLPELNKRHYQNYLSLCPNHAAMFKHANDVSELLRDLFLELENNELEVILAGADNTIYFNKTHINDIKTIIDVDDNAI